MSSGRETVASSTFSTQSTPGAFPSPPPIPIISSHHSLTQAVHARRAEYTKPATVRLKIGAWNVASLKGTEKDVEGWFVQGRGVSESLTDLNTRFDGALADNSKESSDGNTELETVSAQERRRTKKESTLPKGDSGLLPGGTDIGLYVLGLQEIVDVSSPTEALRPYTDPHPARKWRNAVTSALPAGYELVAEQQLIGLLLLIYASPAIASTISSVSTTSVGTGMLGYMGNKGAVTARLVLGETTRLVFINCHLAAGTEKGSLERRNWDAAQIATRTRFDPVQDSSGTVEESPEGIGDEDFAFWFGDLNYRLETLPGDEVRRLLMLHTRNEYDKRQHSLRKIDNELGNDQNTSAPLHEDKRHSEDSTRSSRTLASSLVSSSPTLPPVEDLDLSTDPTSPMVTISSLLPHDQLHQQMKQCKAFYDGWKEGPIEFLPTYKYDVGSVGMFDSSEKKRGPSWCDRILYRTRRDRLEYQSRIKEDEAAKRKDAEMQGRGFDKDSGDDVLFDYDPETDGAEEAYEEQIYASEDPDIVSTKAGFEDRLHLEYYTSHQRVLSSDHKPLDAVFLLIYEAADPELKAKVHQEVARELDKAENEGRPAITIVVDNHSDHDGARDESVNLGEVRYDHPKKRTVTVANTGRVPATVGFVDRSTDGVFPSWLKVHVDQLGDNEYRNSSALHQYTLQPGDAVNIDIVARITDMEQVRALNEGKSYIEDILVLRVQDGRDHFLPVRGVWQQSSFGRSLDKLIRIPEGGVRRLQHQRPDDSSHKDDNRPVKWAAPREVFRLTESIEELVERALAEWAMKHEEASPPWDVVGWPFVQESWGYKGPEREDANYRVREALDTGEPFVWSSELDTISKVEVLAETLLWFLKSLEDGIVTEALWTELSDAMAESEKSRKSSSAEDQQTLILDTMSASPAHSISFTFLTFMLAQLANEISPVPSLPATPSTPKTPDRLLGRTRAPSQDPASTKRRQVERKFAEVFSNVMIKGSLPAKGRERMIVVEKRRKVVEVFLRMS